MVICSNCEFYILMVTNNHHWCTALENCTIEHSPIHGTLYRKANIISSGVNKDFDCKLFTPILKSTPILKRLLCYLVNRRCD